MSDWLPIYLPIIVPVVLLALYLLIHKRPWARRATLLCSLLICVAAVCSPALWTVAWHLRHGNRVSFGQYVVHVPIRWYVDEAQTVTVHKELSLTKLPLFLFLDRPCGFISLNLREFPVRKDPEDTLKTWVTLYWMVSSTRDTVSGPVRMQLGAQHAACMQSVSGLVPSRASASCILIETGSIVDFTGDQSDLGTFYDFVRSIHSK